MNDEKLREQNPELYRIAREGATEPAFTGEYIHTKADGMYHCAVCDTPLFSSETKFDSGSGWPSFTDPVVAEAVTLVSDDSHGMRRTEVRCAKCDAHLGHVFPDGPEKNGKVSDRFCINSISLDLKPKRTESTDSLIPTSSDADAKEGKGWWDTVTDSFEGSSGDGGGDGGD